MLISPLKQSSHISELTLSPFSSYRIECLIIGEVANGCVKGRFNQGDVGQDSILLSVAYDCIHHLCIHPSKSAKDVSIFRA